MAFQAGQRLTATALNLAIGEAAFDIQNAGGDTTSTSFTPTLSGADNCEVTFTAPASGSVVILFQSRIANSGSAFSNCAPEVREGDVIGSGTVVAGASFNNSIGINSNVALRCDGHVPVNGLTPGDTYNVQLTYAVISGTGSFAGRKLTVIPA